MFFGPLFKQRFKHLPSSAVPCLYFRHILGKFGVTRLIAVRLGEAIFFILIKQFSNGQKDLVPNESVQNKYR